MPITKFRKLWQAVVAGQDKYSPWSTLETQGGGASEGCCEAVETWPVAKGSLCYVCLPNVLC